jgi:1,4-alpha-glucan branching enzyme
MVGLMRVRLRTLPKLLAAVTGALVIACAPHLEERIASPIVDGGRVTFRLKSPSSRTVQVAGDFNNWALGDAESGEVLVGSMRKGENGVWELTLTLPPGRYRYRYLLGEANWFLDPGNPRIVDDGRGGKANLLIVP